MDKTYSLAELKAGAGRGLAPEPPTSQPISDLWLEGALAESRGRILERVAPADIGIMRGDGRTVYGIAVPFDTPATVNDGQGPYREVFRRGAFTKTIKENGSRVKFLANHNRHNPIGKAITLREDAAGLYGEFRVSKTPEGDNALELLRDGVYDSFSIGFAKVKERVDKSSGLVERTEAALKEVSALAFPAYANATVMGVRSQFTDEELERILDAIRNLDTQTLEAAATGTSEDEPSANPDEPVVGHSVRTRTRSQRQALLLKTLERTQ